MRRALRTLRNAYPAETSKKYNEYSLDSEDNGSSAGFSLFDRAKLRKTSFLDLGEMFKNQGVGFLNCVRKNVKKLATLQKIIKFLKGKNVEHNVLIYYIYARARIKKGAICCHIL